MLNQFNLPETPGETKQERLEQVADQVLDHLPFQVKILAGNLINSFRQALHFEDFDEQIDNGLEKLKEVIDYVQYGTYPSE
ncbi:hypothetical protein [Priestia aryabhattai]|uniref:hypothetical protein n=1 Tax=Priestia aryabhattai TaxID=412384 RepID=UPI002E202C15|nr:hypothetical protein [Priestia aryabhattai]